MMTQEIIAAKSGKLQAVVAELLRIVAQAVDERLPAHVVERSLLGPFLPKQPRFLRPEVGCSFARGESPQSKENVWIVTIRPGPSFGARC